MTIFFRNWKPALRWLVPVCIILPSYVLPFLFLPSRGFWINDGGCKYIQTISLIRNHYSSAAIPWPGESLDPELEFQPFAFPFGQKIEGELYGYYSTVFSFLTSWPYRLCGVRGLYLLPLFGGVALLPAVWIMAGRLPGAWLGQPISVFLVALCSPIWFYSVSFWEQTPAVALISWATVLVLHHLERGGLCSLAGASALGAVAITLRDDQYLLVGALMGVVILQRRNLKATCLAFLIGCCCLSPLWVSHWLSTGNPLGHHISSVSPLMNGWQAFLLERWIAFKSLLLDAHIRTPISVLLSGPCLLLWIWRPSKIATQRIDLPRVSLAWSCLLAIVAAWGHWSAEAPLDWMMRTNGLFVSAPFLLLGFHRFSSSEWSDDPSFTLLRFPLVFTLLYACLSPATSLVGIHWGSRHLLALFPVMGALAGSFLGYRWQKRDWGVLAWTGVVCVVVFTFLLQLHSLHLLHQRKSFCEELNRRVAEREEEVVVTVNWYLPQELAMVFFEKCLFLAQTPKEEDLLLDRLRSQGVRRVLRIGTSPRRRSDAITWARMQDEMGFLDLELQSLELEP